MKRTLSQKEFKKKIAYIKNGDVVEELKMLANLPESDVLGNGGPYHYIGSFLKWRKKSKTLLISLGIQDKLIRKQNDMAAQVINTKRYRNSLWQLIFQFNAFIRIFRSLFNFKPTLILCAVSGGLPLAACLIVSKIYNVPFVHSRHMRIEHFKPSVFGKLRSMFDNWLIRKADTVLCNGPYLHDQLIRIGVKKKRIIQFGLPYRNIYNVPVMEDEHCDSPRDGCKLLYIGRVEENKGALDLLLACRPILKNNDAVSLTYIGNGRLLNSLMRTVKRLELEGKVFFLGHLQHSLALQTMRNHDVIVVPTRQKLGEGRCKSVIEGLIMGIPIVAPNYGAFNYLVEDGINGLLYSPDDINDLNHKIKFLVEHPELRYRLGKNAKRTGDCLKEPDITFLQALDEASNLLS